MNFPGKINGPKFSAGDIVSFNFPEAELTMRLPVVSNYSNVIDNVSSDRNFINIDTSDWIHFGDDGFCYNEIAVQSWRFEDSVTYDDVAECLLKITIQKHGSKEANSLFSLNSKTFRKQQLQWLSEDFPTENRSDWPRKENNFFAQDIKKNFLNGLQVQLERVRGAGREFPDIYALFSLGKYFTLAIDFSLLSLHYPDRKNPYSEEFLQDFKFKLFDDFISHIHIEYTPETIALIEQRTKELSA